jgi:arginine utilization protein RocB
VGSIPITRSIKKSLKKNLKKFLTRTKRYGNILNVLDENKEVNNAGVAELADARDLKSRG